MGRSMWVLLVVTAVVTGATMAGAAGCSSRSPLDGAVRPIDADAATPGAEHARSTHVDPADEPRAPTPVPNPGPASTEAPSRPDEDPLTDVGSADVRRRTVDRALDRYDRALTALHGDPSAVLRPDDPAMVELSVIVDPGSVLAADLRTGLIDRLSAGSVVRSPGPDGTSWVHRSTSTAAVGSPTPTTSPAATGPSGSIDFEWCSWSPGVAVDRDGGAVLDDSVGHATGTGTVVDRAGTWVLTALDQTTIEVLPAGAPNPCPGVEG